MNFINSRQLTNCGDYEIDTSFWINIIRRKALNPTHRQLPFCRKNKRSA